MPGARRGVILDTQRSPRGCLDDFTARGDVLAVKGWHIERRSRQHGKDSAHSSGKSRMRISIIIPTFARPKALSKCLDSLAAQSRPPDELVIVHRRSDIATAEVVSGRKDLHIVPIAVGEIAKIARLENCGLEQSSGEIVCFIDDDAVAPPSWLTAIEGHFASDKSLGAVGGPILPVVDGEPVRRLPDGPVLTVSWYGRVRDGPDAVPSGLLFVDHLPGSNMAFRAEVLGRFAEGLRGYCYRFELERCLALRRSAWLVAYDPALAVEHHSQPRPASGTGFRERVAMHCNNTCVLLFTFVWGDGGCPGLLRILLSGARRLSPSRAIREFTAGLVGKMTGVTLSVLKPRPDAPPQGKALQ